MKRSRYHDYFIHTAPEFLHGILTGIVVGALIFLFRLAAEKLTEFSRQIYAAVRAEQLFIPLLFIGLILCALAMALLHRYAPSAKGGGIPRSEGILRGILPLRAGRTLLATLGGSFLSFFCGLPLGSEGPSVLSGTAAAHLTGRLTKKDREAKDRYVMTGGACAGFGVATGSPVSAILFALEEVHKRFTPMLLIVTSAAVLSATAVSRMLCQLCGLSPALFTISDLPDLALADIGYVFLAALAVSLAVFLFDLSVSAFNRCTRTRLHKIPHALRLVIVFCLTGLIGLFAVDALFGGTGIILALLENQKTTLWIALLFVIRFVMMVLVSNSGATGGIFVPTLALGALVGGLSARLFVLIGMDPSHAPLIILLAMAAFMGGTMRAPLTALVFFIEVTAQYENLFFVAIAVFLVYFLTEIFNRTSFYDLLLEAMEEDEHQGKTPQIGRFELHVCPGAFVIGKAVRDVLWPHSAIVTSITRADKDTPSLDNGGEKKMYEGDTITIKVQFYDEDELRTRLASLTGKDAPIRRLS